MYNHSRQKEHLTLTPHVSAARNVIPLAKFVKIELNKVHKIIEEEPLREGRPYLDWSEIAAENEALVQPLVPVYNRYQLVSEIRYI